MREEGDLTSDVFIQKERKKKKIPGYAPKQQSITVCS